MKKKWRLILDDKLDGYYNMAVDEFLIDRFISTGFGVFRVYGWRKPIVSLGYSQKTEDVLKESNKFPVVRRITGGASVIHFEEITYSLVCSRSCLNLPFNVKEAYSVLTAFLLDFYGSFGLEASYAKDLVSQGLGQYGSFCFSSWEKYDVIVSGKKIGGNAQKRLPNVIFQHGSIPQQINYNLIESAIKDSGFCQDKTISLNTALNLETDFSMLKERIVDSFRRTFNIDFFEDNLSDTEIASVNKLVENKYKTDRWNYIVR